MNQNNKKILREFAVHYKSLETYLSLQFKSLKKLLRESVPYACQVSSVVLLESEAVWYLSFLVSPGVYQKGIGWSQGWILDKGWERTLEYHGSGCCWGVHCTYSPGQIQCCSSLSRQLHIKTKHCSNIAIVIRRRRCIPSPLGRLRWVGPVPGGVLLQLHPGSPGVVSINRWPLAVPSLESAS